MLLKEDEEVGDANVDADGGMLEFGEHINIYSVVGGVCGEGWV